MRKILLLIGLLLTACPAWAAIEYVSDQIVTSAATEPLSGDLSHACASNCIAVITHVCEDNSSTNCVPDSVTVEGVAATAITGANGCVNDGTTYNCVYQYYYLSPSTDAGTTYALSTPGNPNYHYLHVTFFSGVDQSSPINDTDKASYTSGTTASITLTTTTTGEMLFSAINLNVQTWTADPNNGETEIEDTGTLDAKIAVEYLLATTATNYNMTWAINNTMTRSQQSAFSMIAASDRRIIT